MRPGEVGHALLHLLLHPGDRGVGGDVDAKLLHKHLVMTIIVTIIIVTIIIVTIIIVTIIRVSIIIVTIIIVTIIIVTISS